MLKLRNSVKRVAGYKVQPVPDSVPVHSIVPPTRGVTITVPGFETRTKQYFECVDEMLHHCDLPQYVGCVTAEMRARSIPHVAPLSDSAALVALYKERAPALLRRLVSEFKPFIQTLNKVSKIGFPFLSRPLRKKETIKPGLDEASNSSDPASLVKGGFSVLNVRLQTESTAKERTYNYLGFDGVAYSRTITKEDRAIRLYRKQKNSPTRYGSRVRNVVNPAFLNYLNQCLDSAFHNALLQYPVFHHNLYSPTGTLPFVGRHFCFDVKHFERHTGPVAEARASIIGGRYEQVYKALASLPYLCPCDNWKKFFFLWAADDFALQFGSGLSPVSPLQKEIFFCLYQEFAERHLGVHPRDSMDWVLKGGDERLIIRNYGDDNSLSGQPAVQDKLFAFMSEYLTVEPEIPLKFLGMLEIGGRFLLGTSSYVLKTWLGERAPFTAFRPYPYFGWREKRRLYANIGVPALRDSVFPFEDQLLERNGLPWFEILKRASEEEAQIGEKALAFKSAPWLLGKSYLFTDEEKLASGLYDGFDAKETATYISRLLSPELRALNPLEQLL